jgi:heat shock protein HspQ
MAVQTTNNKPINPRGNDQSPKGYNRAELYTGKALDFDGVNDYVTVENITDTYKSFCLYFKPDADITAASSYERLFGIYEQYFGISTGSATGITTGETLIFMPNGGGRFGTTMEFVADTWYHVAVVAKESDNTYLMYINAQDKTDLVSGTHTPAAATKIRLAWDAQGSGTKFNGQIANFKAFSEVLTAAQVSDLYNNPEKIVPTGVADSALKLWLPMMEGAGTTAINGAPDALGSELITNGTFDTDSDWTKGTGTTISGGKANFSNATGVSLYQSIGTQSGKVQVSFNVSNYSAGTLNVYSGGNQSIGTINVEANANGFYSCYVERGGGNANIIFGSSDSFTGSIDDVSVKEVSGYGTINGATWTHGIGAPVAQTSVIDWNKRYFENVANVLIPQGLTAGRDLLGNLFENVRKQGALNLDGNSWAEVHDNASLDFGTGSFTLEAWAKAKYTSGGSIYNVIMILGGNASTAPNAAILVDNIVRPQAMYNNQASVTPAQTTGDWYHIVAAYDETDMFVFINGAQVLQNGRTAVDITNTLVKYIGRDSSTQRYYSDQIAQPRIYNRALTAEEVERNYTAGKYIYTND